MNDTKTIALLYASKGYALYPMNAGTKIPLANAHGFKDASTDTNQIAKWFSDTDYNVGLSIENTNLIVVDVDRNHSSGVDGVESLKRLLHENKSHVLPSDTLVQRSGNGGLHYFFKCADKSKLKNKQSAFFKQSAIDVLVTGGVVIPPSTINGNKYTTIGNRKFDDIKPCPQWLLNEIQPQSSGFTLNYATGQKAGKKWTGKLLDYMVAGSQSGNRNVWLAQLAGKLFHSDASPQTVYNLMLVANSNFIDDPLEEKEVNQIFRSILSREAGN
ncbi:bifunctional DNA primase/polymerase [Paucilactobacillus nenjiangensis]|uniref:bifunctional DNA primase/polymerase n=1 Tax=Paucilactobacillus nenjiangensis TaxID=1296540 RepID=UPI0028D5DCA6|nr:bifunctional DNA primase/polymerase [Paucilactobacillus nenjiangensis]